MYTKNTTPGSLKFTSMPPTAELEGILRRKRKKGGYSFVRHHVAVPCYHSFPRHFALWLFDLALRCSLKMSVKSCSVLLMLSF